MTSGDWVAVVWINGVVGIAMEQWGLDELFVDSVRMWVPMMGAVGVMFVDVYAKE